MMAADDWGTQRRRCLPQGLSDPVPAYRRPDQRRGTRLAPRVRPSCTPAAAIYSLIDLIIESGFDILNPVSVGREHSYAQWRTGARGASHCGARREFPDDTPLGTVEDVRREVTEAVRYPEAGQRLRLLQHHPILLAEIAPEKIIAMYRAAAEA